MTKYNPIVEKKWGENYAEVEDDQSGYLLRLQDVQEAIVQRINAAQKAQEAMKELLDAINSNGA